MPNRPNHLRNVTDYPFSAVERGGWEDERMSREQVRRPEIVVDLGAIRRNVGRLRDLVAPDGSDVMVVVKADGYGHGMLEAAYAGRRALARRRHERGGGAAPRGG